MLSQLNAAKAAQSGESDQPQAGNANLKLSPNSFQQMLQRMLASKDEATSSANQDNLNSSQVKLPWTQAPGSAYAPASATGRGVDNANQQEVEPAETSATDQPQTQANLPPLNKGSVGDVTITRNSPGRMVEQGQQPITEPDVYRNWYNLREKYPEAALNLAQYYLQSFPESSDPLQAQRAQAVRNYVNEAYRRPRVTVDLHRYVEQGGSPTDREVSDLIAASEGFTPEEAEAYRREAGRDFYTSRAAGSQAERTAQDEMLVNRGLVDRAAADPGWMASIPELQPGAIKFLRDWLQNHRHEAARQKLRDLPDLEAKLAEAKRIVTLRGGPLTDEEAQDLSIDELPGGGWMRLPVTAIGGYVKGVDELIAGAGGLFSGLSSDEARRFQALNDKVVNRIGLNEKEEEEYQSLRARSNWAERHGQEGLAAVRSGLNIYKPQRSVAAELAQGGGELFPQLVLTAALPGAGQALSWAATSYLKAKGGGATEAQALQLAALAAVMSRAMGPMRPLQGAAGDTLGQTIGKTLGRGLVGTIGGTTLAAAQGATTPEEALGQGLQFGAMGMAGAGGAGEEDVPGIGPRAFDPLVQAWAEGRLAGPENAHLREELGRRFGLNDPVPERPPFGSGSSGAAGGQEVDTAAQPRPDAAIYTSTSESSPDAMSPYDEPRTPVGPGPRPQPVEGSSGGPGSGKPASKRTREAVRRRDSNICVYCGTVTTDKPGPDQSNIDHSDPRSRGGDTTMKNLQNTCRTCNQRKKARTNREYQQMMKGSNEPGT